MVLPTTVRVNQKLKYTAESNLQANNLMYVHFVYPICVDHALLYIHVIFQTTKILPQKRLNQDPVQDKFSTI